MARRRSAAEIKAERELILALAAQDRFMGSVFVTPKGQRDYDERVERAYAAYKIVGGDKDL